ncbi:hypothetical protein ACSQ67_001126 [Phaseolus vulgaris]
MWIGKWNGGGLEVDTEASSDEGSLGASLCDSVGSDFGEAGEGEVGVVGGGRLGFEETVRGKLDSDFLGKEREPHGVVAQALLTATNETKARRRKGKESFGEGVDKCSKSHSIGSVSERLGASFYVKDVQGELHVDRGPYSKAEECSPLIGRLERGAVSGKEVVCAFNDQATFSKTLESRRDLKSKCVQDGGYENVVVGIDSEQLGFVSRVEDSLGTRSLMDEVERSGAGVVGEGVDGWSRLKDHPKPSASHALIGNGHADFDKLEEEEEVRRPEIPTTKESGRNVSLGGLSAGLGTGAEDVLEGGVILSLRRVGSRVWLGKSEENIP